MEFPSSPTNGQLFTNFGKVYEYSISKNAWFPISTTLSITDIVGVAEFSTPSVGDILINDGSVFSANPVPVPSLTDVYATGADLPITGNTIGDIALVSGTDSLYVFNGTTWYNVSFDLGV